MIQTILLWIAVSSAANQALNNGSTLHIRSSLRQDDQCIQRYFTEAHPEAAARLFDLAQRMDAAADTAEGIVSQITYERYGVFPEAPMTDLHAGARNVAQLATRYDPRNGKYRFLLAKLIWDELSELPLDSIPLEQAQKALNEARCALQYADSTDTDTVNWAKYYILVIGRLLQRQREP